MTSPSVALPRRRWAAYRTQLSIAAAQVVTGIGNLAFLLLVARRLDGPAFAELATFAALYLGIHLPGAALAAGAAGDPDGAVRLARRTLLGGVAAGAALAVATPWLGAVLGLRTPVVLLLAAAAPGAGLLGLRRGLLYAGARHGQLVRSFLAEPLVRLTAGLALAAAAGATGAAVAIVGGGYLALLASGGSTALPAHARRPGGTATATATAAAFALLAVVQNQDLVVTNALVGGHAAAGFAALSTLGGAAAFAIASAPMLTLGSSPDEDDSAGLRFAVAVGIAAVIVAVVAAEPLAGLFHDARPDPALITRYVAAMAALGVARTVAARACRRGQARRMAVTVVAVGVAHLAALLLFGDGGWRTTHLTLAGSTALVGALALPDVALKPARPRRQHDRRAIAAVVGCMAVAAVVRLVNTRGIWVDEAISIAQARQPFGRMLEQLAASDVHPPGHHAILWLTVRALGTSELAVRLPSILAGVLLVPAVGALARTLYDRRTGLIAAALTTVAPLAVWYSQEARMYALFMLAGTVSVWAQVRAMRGGHWAWWPTWGVAAAAMVWFQWFAVLPLAVQFGAAAVAWWQARGTPEARRIAGGTAGALAVTAAAVAPLVPILRDELTAYTSRRGEAAPNVAGNVASSHDPVSVYAVIANGIWAVWGYHADRAMTQVGALWPFGMLAALGALGRGRSRATTLVLACALVPGLVLFGVAVVKRDLFELRYFALAVPLLLVLLARSVTAVFRSTALATGAATLVLGTLALGLFDQQLNGANPRRYDFAGAMAQVERHAEPGDVVLYEPVYLADVLAYYGPDLDRRPLGDLDEVPDDAGIFIVATDRVADVRATTARVGDALARIEQDDRAVVDRTRHPNVTVWELR